MISWCYDRVEMPSPSFPSEIFWMFIEALGDDQDSLRACSLVSSVFRHLCGLILYRDIALDCEEKVDTFIQFGGRSDILQYVKSFTVIFISNPHVILDPVSRKASLETLCLHLVRFCPEPLIESILSRLNTVTVVILQECCFEEFEDFVSFIRCFPLCEILRLRRCTWIHHANTKLEPVERPPVHDVAPVHLEVMNDFSPEWGWERSDQGKIFGAPWLGLTGLKSFKYEIGGGAAGEAASELVLGKIATCEQLEELDLTILHSLRRDFGECGSSPLLSNPELIELAEISDRLVNTARRSCQNPHPQMRLWTPSLMAVVLSRRQFPALPDP